MRLGEDWPRLREGVLRRLRAARDRNPREAISELLGRLPEAKAPLAFCTEMIAVFLLNTRRVGSRAGGLSPLRAVRALRGSRYGLETLPGLSVGVTLSAEDGAGPSLTSRLLDQAHRYQSNLSHLSEEARSALIDFLEEALEALD
jgi:hypothetical protein